MKKHVIVVNKEGLINTLYDDRVRLDSLAYGEGGKWKRVSDVVPSGLHHWTIDFTIIDGPDQIGRFKYREVAIRVEIEIVNNLYRWGYNRFSQLKDEEKMKFFDEVDYIINSIPDELE